MSSPDSTKYLCRSAISLPFQVNVGLVVDDVLDASILEEKYTQLIELWPHLGGSLSSIFDTRKFQCGCTADFKSRTVNKDLASFLPSWRNHSEGSTPEILIDDPASLDSEFLFQISSSSKAISKLRVTVLDDATLLGFSFYHSHADGQSSYDIIRYFCDLLSDNPLPTFVLPPDASGGRISDLVRDEPAPASTQPQPQPRPHPKIFVTKPLTALKFHAKYMLLRLSDALGLSKNLTQKTIYIPETWVDEVRARAQEELELEAGDEKSGIHLTRNDIIAAFYLKLVYSWQKPTDSPVDYLGPINYRGLLEPANTNTEIETETEKEKTTYYMHNSIIFLLAQFTTRELQTTPITQIALRIRLATLNATTNPPLIKQEILRIETELLAPAMQDIRGSVRYGAPMVSPWSTFNYTGLDFSGARARAGTKTDGRGRKPAVIFVCPNVPLTLGDLPSPIAIGVKDGKGGYWVRGANSRRGWEGFERGGGGEGLFGAA
ncbi:hypothetical protein BJX70DRAFT_397932 [Aspergillus crustosus]